MFQILVWVVVLIVGLVFLIKSSDVFTEAAEKLGVHIGIPPFIVGVTIVSIGTSLPELVSSIIAVLRGATEIVVGNVIGSNIANIFLVLGLAAVCSSGLRITRELIHVDLPILVSSAFLFGIMILDGSFSFFEATIALIGVLIYLGYIMSAQREFPKKRRKKLDWKTPALLAITPIVLYFSANYTIEAVIQLSTLLGIGTEIVAVTAVALGTSLPEIVVSVQAARKGKPEIAVGNVLGSNIFNTLAVMGVPALIAPLVIPKSLLLFGLPVMIIATLLYFFIEQDREISPWEGGFLILFYVYFVLRTLTGSVL